MEWDHFCDFSKLKDISALRQKIFKQNRKNYIWSQGEDDFLEKIIRFLIKKEYDFNFVCHLIKKQSILNFFNKFPKKKYVKKLPKNKNNKENIFFNVFNRKCLQFIYLLIFFSLLTILSIVFLILNIEVLFCF